MKKLNFLFLFFSTIVLSQPQVNIWRVTPDSVCPGDSIKIDYKASWPTVADNTLNYFFLNPGTVTLWSGNWSILKSRPKEHYAALSINDSTYWIKVRIPLSSAIGSHTVFNSGNSTGTVYVKNCNCIISAGFAWTAHFGGVTTFTSTSTGTSSITIYLWDFGIGYVSGSAITSHTFISSGQYPVKLKVVNPTCTDSTIIWANADMTIDGIKEYESNAPEPIYFNLQGARIEKEYNALIIEQVGLNRKKVIIQK